ncbi:1-acyl-sn-glycerol-3-phosphate acyltransferase [Luteibacter sp. Sphag1AF]|uniref:lysophospholipid acyltransferase family protein n=1 Tax=Luteibacter sp. Sphag1AF TaxID=2587031 RepID=UPI001616D9EE|nr:lysophospholipid acyltransferase family protein [Luteibacter sp. Sphag1AF]MBB3227264.1 1-acyl-sn-glycerol-3-phosphate acyltransferase [Luteibacter sp. Sphag1AF]
MEVAPTTVTRRTNAYPLRLVSTALSFAFFGMGGLLLRALILPVVCRWPGSPEVRRRRARRTVGWAFWLHYRFMIASGVLHFRFEGKERLGKPGQMIVANHPSLIDVVFLLGNIRDANCIVKRSLWRNPFMRGPISTAQYISNSGGPEMLDEAAQVLADGQALLVFPEGTRTTPGTAPCFHRGAAAIALRSARIVTPVFITVTPSMLTKAEPWYRIPHRRPTVTIRVGEDIEVATFRESAPLPIASRRLNDQLHDLYARELGT